MRSVGDALSFVWESDRSCRAARLGGEPLAGRGGKFMMDGRLHNVVAVMADWRLNGVITGEYD